MTFDANSFKVVFNGYFVPPSTGAYTHSALGLMTALLFTLDSIRLSRAATYPMPPGTIPLDEFWFRRDSETKCASIDMVEGFYYSFRFMYGNEGAPNSLTATV